MYELKLVSLFLECPYPVSRKEPDVRKSSDGNFGSFGFYTGRSYTAVDHINYASNVSLTSTELLRDST